MATTPSGNWSSSSTSSLPPLFVAPATRYPYEAEASAFPKNVRRIVANAFLTAFVIPIMRTAAVLLFLALAITAAAEEPTYTAQEKLKMFRTLNVDAHAK